MGAKGETDDNEEIEARLQKAREWILFMINNEKDKKHVEKLLDHPENITLDLDILGHLTPFFAENKTTVIRPLKKKKKSSQTPT